MTADPALADATRLVARTWLLLLVLGATAVAAGAVVVGPEAAASGAVGIGLVAVLFGVSALLLWAAVARDANAVGLFVGGFGARIVIYLLVLDALAATAWVHGPSLALATGVGVAVTLAAELVWLHRSPHLFEVDLERRHPIGDRIARDPEVTL